MRLASLLGFVLATASVPAIPSVAYACGGCFAATETQQIVTDHRMAMAIGPSESILWDQIRYTGNPEDFAWILPVWGDVRVELAAGEFFDELEQGSAVQVTSPFVNIGCGGGGGGFGCGAASFSADGSSRTEDAGVQILNQETVGPYQTVTLRGDTTDALTTWLRANGYALPDSMVPVVEYYQERQMDFLALRLSPGEGVQAMQPVRIRYSTANMVLPLRMVAAGVGDKVGITLWVFGNTRYEPVNFGVGYIDESELVWDWDTNTSNYRTLFENRIESLGGRAWIIEHATTREAFGVVPSTESRSDWNAAEGVVPGGAWITRMRTDLLTRFLDTDLQLQVSIDSPTTVVTNRLQAQQTIGTEPSAACGEISTLPGPGDLLRRPAHTLASLAASALALMYARRRRHRG
jgi:hypothetical protein